LSSIVYNGVFRTLEKKKSTSTSNKSPLPLTVPRDAVPHAHRAVHTHRQSA